MNLLKGLRGRYTPRRALGVAVLLLSLIGQAAQVNLAGFTVEGQGGIPKTLSFIGQTKDGITAYDASGMPAPAGYTVYVGAGLNNLTGMSGNWCDSNNGFKLRTTAKLSADDDSGRFGPQDFSYITGLKAAHPDMRLAVGLYISGEWGPIYKAIATGQDETGTHRLSTSSTDTFTQSGACLQKNIQSIISQLIDLQVPVYLRIGYEVEGPWNAQSPDDFKDAWGWIANQIDAIYQAKLASNPALKKNIATVWQLAASCDLNAGGKLITWDKNGTAADPTTRTAVINAITDIPAAYDAWYPTGYMRSGSATPGAVIPEPDFTALSLFTPQNCSYGTVTGYQVTQKVVDYLNTKGKPVMVTESAPQGYYQDTQSSNLETYGYKWSWSTTNRGSRAETATSTWNAWFDPFFRFLFNNRSNIRAFAYINDNWDTPSYSGWRCSVTSAISWTNCFNGAWGDSRVTLANTINTNWQGWLFNGLNHPDSWYRYGGTGATVPLAFIANADTTPPSLNTSLSFASDSTPAQPILTWSNNATDNVGVTGYVVYRMCPMTNTIALAALPPSTTRYVLSHNVGCSYDLAARDAAGNISALSNVIGYDETVPFAPSNVSAYIAPGGPGGSTATITWTAASDNCNVGLYCTGISSYEIQSLVPGLGWLKAGSASGLSTLFVTNTSSSTAIYRVIAIDMAGNRSVASNTSASISLSAPGTATLLIQSSWTGSPMYPGGSPTSWRQYKLTWGAATGNGGGVQSYQIFRMDPNDPQGWHQIDTVAGNVLAYTSSAMTAQVGQPVYFEVRAVDYTGTIGAFSNQVYGH